MNKKAHTWYVRFRWNIFTYNTCSHEYTVSLIGVAILCLQDEELGVILFCLTDSSYSGVVRDVEFQFVCKILQVLYQSISMWVKILGENIEIIFYFMKDGLGIILSKKL